MRDRFHWARLLAFVTGLVNQDLLLRNEYLIAENRILRGHLPMRLRLSDPSRRVSLGGITRYPARVGWSKWRGTRRWKALDSEPLSVSTALIGTRSSAGSSRDAGCGRREMPSPASTEPKFEFLRGALRTFGKTGVPV